MTGHRLPDGNLLWRHFRTFTDGTVEEYNPTPRPEIDRTHFYNLAQEHHGLTRFDYPGFYEIKQVQISDELANAAKQACGIADNVLITPEHITLADDCLFFLQNPEVHYNKHLSATNPNIRLSRKWDFVYAIRLKNMKDVTSVTITANDFVLFTHTLTSEERNAETFHVPMSFTTNQHGKSHVFFAIDVQSQLIYTSMLPVWSAVFNDCVVFVNKGGEADVEIDYAKMSNNIARPTTTFNHCQISAFPTLPHVHECMKQELMHAMSDIEALDVQSMSSVIASFASQSITQCNVWCFSTGGCLCTNDSVPFTLPPLDNLKLKPYRRHIGPPVNMTWV